jgi:alkanesulfonate monooxygenase SsuD/methylene tetrahydromethanopterin reductase-like flavin-dependent oxidoreductase (luciferase family)
MTRIALWTMTLEDALDMKFGIFNIGMWHETQTQEEIFQGIMEQAVLGDSLGYDSFWLGEHHFSRHGILTDCMVLAAAIAAKTERIRIGSAIVVLPFHNPIQLAEQAAMVDILSNGRLELGVGVGYQRREFEGLGLDIDDAREKFKDNYELLMKAWQDGPLDHHSKYYSMDASAGIEVLPKPVQKPHPPVYQAVSISPESVEAAASKGIPIMVGGPTDVLGLAPQVIALWQSKMREYGFDPTGIDIPCAKGIYVAETDEEAAADIAAVDAFWDLKLLQQIGSPISASGELPRGYENWSSRVKEHEKNALNPNRAGTPPLIGSVETVRERLAALQETGVNYLFGQFGLPGMPEEKIQRSIKLFAEIMPDFQDAKAGQRAGTAAQ